MPRCFRIARPHLVAFVVAAFALEVFAHRASAIEHDRPLGEPYQLLGRRLVFTTWYFVRPGQPNWINPQTGTGFERDVSVGPDDAQLLYNDPPHGVRLIAEPAQVGKPIVARDRPWEQMGLSINTIIHEGDKFRAWGSCQDAQRQSFYCYLESADGKTWTKPDLGLVEYNGSKENNLIVYAVGTVFVDPSALPEERYKSVKHGHFTPEMLEKHTQQNRPLSVIATEQGSGWYGDAIIGAVSADGLTWTELPEPLSIEPSDTQVVVGYDPRLKKYIMFTRSHMIGPRGEGQPLAEKSRQSDVPRRAIGRSEAADFREFPLSEVIIETGSDMPPADSYYSNCYTTLPGAPDHHVMFPAIFHQLKDTTSIDLFTSYDGRSWHRAPGSPVLPTNTIGQWDGGCVFTRPNLVELPDGSWSVPYTGYLYPHKYPRGAWAYDAGFAVWPKGRLMAIEARERGQFATVAILAPGTKLHINAVTKRAGSIEIEVADLLGKPIAGRSFDDAVPIVGDKYQFPVTWKGGAEDLGVEAGQPVMFRIRMNKARIYGLEFK